ncbi:hypothetical protein TNCV_4453881 [Trichonephila clavipes]|nr:hypothetical protein TNCV_4453881 [Trichonephila clavipes]
MADAQSFELLKNKRKSLRTAVNKVVNELEAELSNSDLNVDRLSELVETLCIKFEPLTLVGQQMEPLFKPEEFDAEFEIAEKYRENVLLWQFRAKKKINEFSKTPVTSPFLQTTLSQSQDEHFRNSDNIRIKVPKYHITRFYENDASKWRIFRELRIDPILFHAHFFASDRLRPIRSQESGAAVSPVNDILKTTNTMICMYADDTAILSRHYNPNTLTQNINEHLAHLEIWFSVWKIALNTTKKLKQYSLLKDVHPLKSRSKTKEFPGLNT